MFPLKLSNHIIFAAVLKNRSLNPQRDKHKKKIL